MKIKISESSEFFCRGVEIVVSSMNYGAIGSES